VLPSCLIKHANLNKTTAVHAAASTNRLNNNNNNMKTNRKLKKYLQVSAYLLIVANGEKSTSQNMAKSPGNSNEITRILWEARPLK
jgi:hypothetical protein